MLAWVDAWVVLYATVMIYQTRNISRAPFPSLGSPALVLALVLFLVLVPVFATVLVPVPVPDPVPGLVLQVVVAVVE